MPLPAMDCSGSVNNLCTEWYYIKVCTMCVQCVHIRRVDVTVTITFLVPFANQLNMVE